MKRPTFRWKYRYGILSVVFVAWAVATLDRGALPVALPYITKEFGLKPFQSSLVLSCFFFGYALAQLPGGVLTDKIGVRKIATISLLWWSAFTAATGMAASLVQMLVVRVLFGLGEGLSPGAFYKTAGVWFPKKERATALAVMFTGISLGTALSPLIVAAIMAVWGWRAAFYALVIPGLMTSALFWIFVKNRPADATRISKEELEEIEDSEAGPSPAAGSASRWKDIVHPDVLKFFFSLLFFDIASFAFQSWLPTYLVQVRGFSMLQMGAAASLPFFLGALGRVAGGWLSDNLFRNNRRALAVSFQVAAGVLLLLTYRSTNAWSLVVLQTLSGFFLVGYQATFWALPINSIPKSRMGLATSFINMGGTLGGLISPLCVGGLLEFSKGSFGLVGIFMEITLAISCVVMFWLPAKTAKSGAELSFD